MSRLGPQKPRVLKKIFRDNGLVVRKVGGRTQGKGDHCVMEHPDDASRATCIPDYVEIDVGLAAEIIKDSGKTIREYLSHLR